MEFRLRLFAVLILNFAFVAPARAYVSSVETLTIASVERTVRTFQLESTKSSPHKTVLIYFHGTGLPILMDTVPDSPYGRYFEEQLLKKLANDPGVVVVAPDALENYGKLAWQTNLAPFANSFDTSNDYLFMKTLFEGWALDPTIQTIIVGGLSSGGYMASRLAQIEIFANKIKKVFIHSASYATCISFACNIPSELPSWHPPTLLIGSENDKVVPSSTLKEYFQKLKDTNVHAELVLHPETFHGYFESDVETIFAWVL